VSTDVMIYANGLSKRYGAFRALDDVSFEVRRGEVVGFLGPNGAGKSTTMRILTCFISPTAGVAKVKGHDVFDDTLAVRSTIGYLPQRAPLYLEMTVLEYLHFAAKVRNLDEGTFRKRARSVVEVCGLAQSLTKEIRHLSHGYRQRVGLAQALIHDPPVLVLDEPTVGLDPKQIIEIRELIKSLAGSHSVILSTHILPEATAVCQRVVIISGGRIVAEDTPDRLSTRLRHSEKIALTLTRPPGDVEARLRQVDGVLDVHGNGPAGHFLLESHLGKDIREDIARLAVTNNWGLIELKLISMTLEDVFLKLTRHEEGVAQGSVAAAGPAVVVRENNMGVPS